MWVFTRSGFLSVVAHQNRPNVLLVRARTLKHLVETLGRATMGAHCWDTRETLDADYRWRTCMSREAFECVLVRLARDVTYSNFKGSVTDVAYHNVLMKVWTNARALDRREDEPVAPPEPGPT